MLYNTSFVVFEILQFHMLWQKTGGQTAVVYEEH